MQKLITIIGLIITAIPIGFALFLHFLRSNAELRVTENTKNSPIMEVTSTEPGVSLRNQMMCDHFGICPRERKTKEFFCKFPFFLLHFCIFMRFNLFFKRRREKRRELKVKVIGLRVKNTKNVNRKVRECYIPDSIAHMYCPID